MIVLISVAAWSTPTRYRHNKYLDEINQASSRQVQCHVKTCRAKKRNVVYARMNRSTINDSIDRDQRDAIAHLLSCRVFHRVSSRVENAPLMSMTSLGIATRQAMSSPVFRLDPSTEEETKGVRRHPVPARFCVVQLASYLTRKRPAIVYLSSCWLHCD